MLGNTEFLMSLKVVGSEGRTYETGLLNHSVAFVVAVIPTVVV